MDGSSTRRRSLHLHCRQSVPATPANSPNGLVGLKHIGQCNDEQGHRNCIYNVINELTETLDFEAMKRKQAEYEQKIAAYQSQVLQLERERKDSHGTVKSLRTMASVIHNLNEKLKQSIETGEDAEWNFKHRIQTIKLCDNLYFTCHMPAINDVVWPQTRVGRIKK